jgi:hypothetical protein
MILYMYTEEKPYYWIHSDDYIIVHMPHGTLHPLRDI